MKTTLRKLLEEHPEWADLPIVTEGKEWRRCKEENGEWSYLQYDPSIYRVDPENGEPFKPFLVISSEYSGKAQITIKV